MGPSALRTLQRIAAAPDARLTPGAALDAQRTLGNAATRQIVARQPAALGDQAKDAQSTDLFFAREGTKAKPVTEERLVNWAADLRADGMSMEHIGARVMHSYHFRGSDAARARWAAFLRDNIEWVLAIPLLRAEQARRKAIEEFSSHTYEGQFSLEGMGFFYARYEPRSETFTVTVPLHYRFEDSVASWVDVTGPKDNPKTEFKNEDRKWTDEDRATWRATFARLVEAFWSRHVLRCKKPGWDGVRRVVVKVAEGSPTDANSTEVTVYRGDNPAVIPHVDKRSGDKGRKAEFSWEDIQTGATTGQPTVLHEFGHMLGLGDEYYRGTTTADDRHAGGGRRWADHSKLVEDQFGYPVPREDETDRTDRFKDSIMNNSGTGKLLLEHGVVFLSTMRTMTGMRDWRLELGG